ncbi:MAG: DUF177 domain-containing protein [Gemmatimonadaceae bacterium]
MLAFTIRDLESHAAVVDGSFSADDPVWEAADVLPSDSVHATGRLSAAGAGRFYWSGRIAGRAQLPCRRCLGPCEASVNEDVHLVFAEVGDDTADDPDVFRIPQRSRELDLRGAVREQWLLAVPTFPLCKDDCRGICPRCGADLNEAPCGCEPVVDDRWAALRALRK